MQKKDSWAFWVLSFSLVMGSIARLVNLDHPNEMVFDESHYVPAARVIAGLEPLKGLEAWATSDTPIIAKSPEPNFSHPILGKLLMAWSIQAFGDHSFAWRFPSAILGILSLLVFFLAAYQLKKELWFASMAVFFLSFDIMHLTHSRIAMLDSLLVFAGICLLYALALLLEKPSHWGGNLLAVLAMGVGLASKFTMALTIGAFLFALIGFSKHQTLFRRSIHAGILGLGGLASYNLSAIYYLNRGLSYGEWWHLQWAAALKVLGPLKAHPYSSMPISWPFNHKPVWYYYKGGDAPMGIVAMGNPVLWWGFLVALVFSLGYLARAKKSMPARIVTLWYLLTYLPLILILWRRSEASFLYHILPSVPAMALGLSLTLTEEWQNRYGHGFVMLIHLAAMAYFAPVIFAIPTAGGYYQLLSRIISF